MLLILLHCFDEVSRTVVIVGNNNYFINRSRNLESVLILYQYYILALETGDSSTAGFAKESYFITYLHNKELNN